MRTTLTITSKGQTTLPIAMRKKLGLPATGGVLRAEFNEQKGQITLSRPLSIDDLSQRLSKYVKPTIEPVDNVDDYYQKYREVNQ